MANVDDLRLRRFVRGELSGDEIQELEAELEARPSLRLALAACVRAEEAGAHAYPSPAILDGPERLVVGPRLGEGGMGTVRQGMQTNLGRAVAVKVLRNETPSGTHRLLQEARLTARLQHPNIVPVHEIIQGRSGELQVVLKEVLGVVWAKVMRDPAALRARFDVADPLDWNLGVLVAVCNALAYAHERGVIHRDVKPSNVMVGDFGEVYLLDWGIAAVWSERELPELAHVEDSPNAGTRAYAAPEQLEGEVEAFGPWTDVYLVGATLYELLGGQAPHARAAASGRGVRPRERVVPPLGAEVPRELVEIVTRTMASDPVDRPLNALEVRAMLEAYRSHRGSLDLATRADRLLDAARGARTRGERAEVELHLGEAEFGYRAALEGWPESSRAREGVRAVAVERVHLAIDDGDVPRARRLLERVGEPEPALLERLTEAVTVDDERRTEATRAAWFQDAAASVVARTVLLAAFGPFWVLGWVALAIWRPRTNAPILGLLVVFIVVGVVIVLSRGAGVLRNHVNRVNVLSATAELLGAIAWTLGAERLGLPVAATELGILLVFTLTPTVVAVTSDPRALVAALAGGACFVAAAVRPAWSGYAVAGAAVAAMLGVVANNLILRRRMARRGG